MSVYVDQIDPCLIASTTPIQATRTKTTATYTIGPMSIRIASIVHANSETSSRRVTSAACRLPSRSVINVTGGLTSLPVPLQASQIQSSASLSIPNPSLGVQSHSTLHALATHDSDHHARRREERLSGLYRGVSSPLATTPFPSRSVIIVAGLTSLHQHLRLCPVIRGVEPISLRRGLCHPLTVPCLNHTLGVHEASAHWHRHNATITHDVTGPRRSSSSSERHTLPARTVAQPNQTHMSLSVPTLLYPKHVIRASTGRNS